MSLDMAPNQKQAHNPSILAEADMLPGHVQRAAPAPEPITPLSDVLTLLSHYAPGRILIDIGGGDAVPPGKLAEAMGELADNYPVDADAATTVTLNTGAWKPGVVGELHIAFLHTVSAPLEIIGHISGVFDVAAMSEVEGVIDWPILWYPD